MVRPGSQFHVRGGREANGGGLRAEGRDGVINVVEVAEVVNVRGL